MKVKIILVMAALAGVLGCETRDPHGRQPLVGSVAFQDVPLPRGVIEFLPLELELTNGIEDQHRKNIR